MMKLYEPCSVVHKPAMYDKISDRLLSENWRKHQPNVIVQKYSFRQISLKLHKNVFEKCHACNQDIMAYNNNKPKIICHQNKAPYQIWKPAHDICKITTNVLKVADKETKNKMSMTSRSRSIKKKKTFCCCSSMFIWLLWTTIIHATEEQNEMCQITEHATRKEIQAVLSLYRCTDGWTDKIHV